MNCRERLQQKRTWLFMGKTEHEEFHRSVAPVLCWLNEGGRGLWRNAAAHCRAGAERGKGEGTQEVRH